jgi:hypothetical protein
MRGGSPLAGMEVTSRLKGRPQNQRDGTAVAVDDYRRTNGTDLGRGPACGEEQIDNSLLMSQTGLKALKKEEREEV